MTEIIGPLGIRYRSSDSNHATVDQVRSHHRSSVSVVYDDKGVLEQVSVRSPYTPSPESVLLDLADLPDTVCSVHDHIRLGTPCWRCYNPKFFQASHGVDSDDHSNLFRLPWRRDLFPITMPTVIAGSPENTDVYTDPEVVFAAMCFDMRSIDAEKPVVIVAETFTDRDGGIAWNSSPYVLPTKVDLSVRQSRRHLAVLPDYDAPMVSQYGGTIYRG